jgi:hypothetical protein
MPGVNPAFFFTFTKKMIAKKDVVAATFYEGYIALAKEDDPLKAIKKNTKEFKKLLGRIPAKKIDHSYAKGKWTIKETLQHIIDAERVFSYRALCFARKDKTALPSFDQSAWAASAAADKREWNELVKEFLAVRKSTQIMFASFDEGQLSSIGTASDNPVNVRALGLIIAGHTTHHMNIFKEKYL